MEVEDKSPLRLLSLDGGGVRGLSSLIILKHLMRTVRPDAPPAPCDFFDLIGGTSTGGLIAIMLGRLRMDIDACIDTYLTISGEVFQPKRHPLDVFGRGSDILKLRGRFSSAKLEEKIQEIALKQEKNANALLKVEKNPKCRVFVCATRADTGIHTALLRSYTSRQVQEVDCTIWEAARATSAASGFFDPIKIGKFGETFVDGASGSNNPVEKVLEEARDIWPNFRERLRCIVSIGTGQPSLSAFGSNLKQIATTLISIATETESTARNFQLSHAPSLEVYGRKTYFRFNVAKGLENIGLEEYKRKAQIAAATKVYLELPVTRTDIETCAGLFRENSPKSHRLPEEAGRRVLHAGYPRMKTLIVQLRAASSLNLTRWCSEVRDPEGGTLEWILRKPAYSALLSGSSPGILHIRGKPGCGKTVIAKHIYHEFDALTGTATKYPFGKTLLFACNAAIDGTRAAMNILASLMAQILESEEDFSQPLLSPLRSLALETQWTYHQLADAFFSLMTGLLPQILDTKKIAIVIDGLDECNTGPERDALLTLFSRVVVACQSKLNFVTMVITSRPYADISFPSALANTHDLNTEKAMDQDLLVYIQHGVTELVGKRPKLAGYHQVIIDKLESRADKMYLLVKLLLEVLLHMVDSSRFSINSILASLPENLSGIYDQIWSRVASAEEGRARMIFSWLLCAIRPFTLTELGVAIATYDFNKWHQQHKGAKSSLRAAGDAPTRHTQDNGGPLHVIPLFHRARFEQYAPFMPLDIEGDLSRLFGPLVNISGAYKLHPESSEIEQDYSSDKSIIISSGDSRPIHVVQSARRDLEEIGEQLITEQSASGTILFRISKFEAILSQLQRETILGNKGYEYSTKNTEPRITLCHQTVQEHFSTKPGFLDAAQTHLQLAELCARSRDGTVTGDSDTESIDTCGEATLTQGDDSRDYSEHWQQHRAIGELLDPSLGRKVRLRRRKVVA